MLSKSDVVELTRDRLVPLYISEKARADALDLWMRGEQGTVPLPQKANSEHRAIAELARNPIIPLAVDNIAQGLFADGYKSPSAGDDEQAWATWLANDLDSRQYAIHRGAIGHALSYATVMPGNDATGPRAVIRGASARRMIAVYQDPADDDWPMYAMRVDASASSRMIRVYDEERVYFLGADGDFGDIRYIEDREHRAGVCPVVRYANLLDLDGRAESDVQRLIVPAARYDKTVYDRLLVQHFNSWKVRTIAGLQDFAGSEVEAEKKKIKLAQDDILVAEDPDTKFGTLDETSMEGFIRAADSDLDTLAAVGQVPVTAFGTSKLANLSADTIAELRAGLIQKLFERRVSFGKSHSQALRLAYFLETGDEAPAAARMTWRDMQPQTMSATIDALGKAVTMLGVPAQAVWHLIPGVDKSTVNEWKADARTAAGMDAIRARLRNDAGAATADPAVGSLTDRRG